MWFGPRIGRSPIDQLEELPWSYVIFNNGKFINYLNIGTEHNYFTLPLTSQVNVY